MLGVMWARSRPLIAALVDAVAPQPGQTICDPACGTGGFLLAAHDYIARIPGLDKAQKKRLKNGTLFGLELVDSVARLCCMNLLLHGIGEGGSGVPPLMHGEQRRDASATLEEDVPVQVKDALAGKHGEYDIVLANAPFGKKSSVTIVNEAGEQAKESVVINRDDCPLKRSRRVLASRSRLRASRVANWASTSNCEPHGHGSSISTIATIAEDLNK